MLYKSALALAVAVAAVPAEAFTTAGRFHGAVMAGGVQQRRSAVFSTPEDDDQEVKDLNLEEMFEVFEAADQTISDAEVGKEGDGKSGDGEDDSIADKIMSLFGGGDK